MMNIETKNLMVLLGITISAIFFEIAIIVSEHDLTAKYAITGFLILVYVGIAFSSHQGYGFYHFKEGKK